MIKIQEFAWLSLCGVIAMTLAAWGGPWAVLALAFGAFAAWGYADIRHRAVTAEPEVSEVRGAGIDRIWWDEIRDMPIGSAIEARPNGWVITRLGGAASDQEEVQL